MSFKEKYNFPKDTNYCINKLFNSIFKSYKIIKNKKLNILEIRNDDYGKTTFDMLNTFNTLNYYCINDLSKQDFNILKENILLFKDKEKKDIIKVFNHKKLSKIIEELKKDKFNFFDVIFFSNFGDKNSPSEILTELVSIYSLLKPNGIILLSRNLKSEKLIDNLHELNILNKSYNNIPNILSFFIKKIKNYHDICYDKEIIILKKNKEFNFDSSENIKIIKDIEEYGKKLDVKFYKAISIEKDNKMDDVLILPHLGIKDQIISFGIVKHYSSIYKNVYLFYKNNIETLNCMYDKLKNIKLINLEDDAIISPYYLNDGHLFKTLKNNINFITLGYHNLDSKYNYLNKVNIDKDNRWLKNADNCMEAFYRDSNIDYSIKNKIFKDLTFLNRNYKKENELYEKLISLIGKDYIIVHEDLSKNYKLNYDLIKNFKKYSIFYFGSKKSELAGIYSKNLYDYGTIFENSKEIHIFDSSTAILVDFLNINTKKTKLFLHIYPKIINNSIGLYKANWTKILDYNGLCINYGNNKSENKIFSYLKHLISLSQYDKYKVKYDFNGRDNNYNKYLKKENKENNKDYNLKILTLSTDLSNEITKDKLQSYDIVIICDTFSNNYFYNTEMNNSIDNNLELNWKLLFGEYNFLFIQEFTKMEIQPKVRFC